MQFIGILLRLGSIWSKERIGFSTVFVFFFFFNVDYVLKLIYVYKKISYKKSSKQVDLQKFSITFQT